jgi:hypothetical protein
MLRRMLFFYIVNTLGIFAGRLIFVLIKFVFFARLTLDNMPAVVDGRSLVLVICFSFMLFLIGLYHIKKNSLEWTYKTSIAYIVAALSISVIIQSLFEFQHLQ